VIILNKQRVKEVLESKGIIEVKYGNDPVWLEGISTDQDNKIQIRDINTNQRFNVDISELKE
jgi:small acid-soluble spore protein H (minor)